jgi:diguanylate cyclase (GGDEF)-like protein
MRQDQITDIDEMGCSPLKLYEQVQRTIQMSKYREQSSIPLEDLLVFHKVARSLGSSLELDAILRTILEHMERYIETDLWTLLMMDRKKNEIYCAIASNSGADWSSFRLSAGEGVAGWVLKHGQTMIVPETDGSAARAQEDLRMIGRAHPSFKIRSVIAMPLVGRTETLGVIQLINPKTERLNDATIAMLHILADYAAIAIENAQDVARIQQLTITDDVTGLYNVRHLYASLERAMGAATKNGEPLSFAFLDLDHFKWVNDEHGHLVGSELLTLVGKKLVELGGAGDMWFRYGGDEFALLMPRASHEAAMAQMRGLISELAATRFELKNGVRLHTRASAGVATAPHDGATMHALIATADARMYHVKESGRGRVCGAADTSLSSKHLSN